MASRVLLNLLIIQAVLLFAVHCVEITVERAELIFYNRTLLGPSTFHYGKFNRTTSALNASFTPLTNFSDGNFLATVSGDQFYHNEYRFTGQKLTVNICEAYIINAFGMVDQLRNAGLEIDLCNIKPGLYVLRNFVMESKYYPEFIPTSKWRVNIQGHHKNLGEVFLMRWQLDIRNKEKINYAD